MCAKLVTTHSITLTHTLTHTYFKLYSYKVYLASYDYRFVSVSRAPCESLEAYVSIVCNISLYVNVCEMFTTTKKIKAKTV